MALQTSGVIKISDIQAELGLSVGAPVVVSGGAVPQAGSLFGEATGVINKVAPHKISEFYGYNQVDDFVMSTTAYGSAGAACGDAGVGSTLWHEGSGDYPEVGDVIWNEGTSTTKFNGGGSWYRIPAEDSVVRVAADGEVLQKEDCNQSFSFTKNRSIIDEDAQSVTVTITSDTSWTMFADQSWATWNSNGSQTITGSGNATLTLDIAAHTGSGDRVVGLDGTYGLGTVEQSITQLDSQFTSHALGYNASSSSTACAASPSLIVSDTGDLSTLSYIGNILNGEPANAGYYSNGSIWKYWNGTAITSGDFC